MRTLAVRLRHHERSALEVAQWLTRRPEVSRVLHPALPDDPGHALWKRDFLGSSSLFGVQLATDSPRAVAALMDGLQLFKIGASFGGFESLILPARPTRVVRPRTEPGTLIRLHVGLEAVEDLIADLDAGFARLNAALTAQAAASGSNRTGDALRLRRRTSSPSHVRAPPGAGSVPPSPESSGRPRPGSE